mgnify:CR=1 FL=1
MEEEHVKPKNYLVWAILSTLFCCLPLGVVSIVYAAKVDGLYQSGDYDGAEDAAEKAKNYATYSAIAGIVVSVLYAIFVIAAAH